MIVNKHFFNQLPLQLAPALLGKVLRHHIYDTNTSKFVWLSATIIEAEAYYLQDKGSHSSLGFTEKRKAMFMPAGTIYMYYARGRDSLNFSASGTGNAVLIKSGYPCFDSLSPDSTLSVMQRLNPANIDDRPIRKLCNGQTLLCRSLGLKVADWNQNQLRPDSFYLDDVGYTPAEIIQCRRLGISPARDAHLPFRFVDQQFARFCTSNPLTRRNWQVGTDYTIVSGQEFRN
jgi:DNA-3-methyladenine glycosylase